MEITHEDEDFEEMTDIPTDMYIETDSGMSLYVKDYGEGLPVILIHGWPLSGEMWEYQIESLVNAGFRVITYDRRGFGKSSQPWHGYTYNDLAEDLSEIIEELDLENVALVGFSMGGGEIARYIGKYGSAKLSKAVFISSVTPFMLQTSDNPDGTPQEEFDKMATELREDRMAFLEDFGKKFYGVNLVSHPVSSAHLQRDMMIAGCASPRATLECLKAFSSTDFRNDLNAITIPTLIIHGDSDKTVPIKTAGEMTAKLLTGAKYIVYDDAPHGLFMTHAKKLNADLIDFLR